MSFFRLTRHCGLRSSGIACLLAAALLLGSTGVLRAQYRDKAFADGELLVKVKHGATERAGSAIAAAGASVAERLRGSEWITIRIPKGMTVRQAEAIFGSKNWVEAAQPNFYYRLQVTPDDTRFADMWGMAKISAPTAWDKETGSADTVVAVIDTGIQYTHEDLSDNIWTNPGEIPGNGVDDDGNGFIDDIHGYDFFFNDPDPLDEHGHGTHTAGTIGAVGNNMLGVTGVNWNVSLMAIKIYDASGFGTTSAMLINAYNYVRLMKERGVNLRVTNNSYGGCPEACGYDRATLEALEALGDAGVLNVFAAGNDGRNTDSAPFYPASYELATIVSIASSTSTDAKSSFSNFGIDSVDLAAPGSSILSTTMTGTGYGTMSGTSMATPHVAGAAALIASHFPSMSNLSLKATILNNIDRLAAWDGVVRTGGRLNVAAALANPTVCAYSLSANSLSATTKGGIYSLQVDAPANCGFSVQSSERWIFPVDGRYSAGPGTVLLRVTVNPTISRSGTVSVAGMEVKVAQSRLNSPGGFSNYR